MAKAGCLFIKKWRKKCLIKNLYFMHKRLLKEATQLVVPRKIVLLTQMSLDLVLVEKKSV